MVYFWFIQTPVQIMQLIKMKSFSIRCLEHQSPLITTRPGFSPKMWLKFVLKIIMLGWGPDQFDPIVIPTGPFRLEMLRNL